ncbi:hypothetical protein Nepgr_032836 [Nepenthes gracilis]|uniref:glutathione transferase n=1 Tax=Nepenthes gracilis TaxID=150966 RepID=A0AAD3TJD9_NEPGR|nr:hypothetical protein Nepgr_032836 [Nepenthes gracilis]
MAIKLYGLGMSTCTARTMACLHEKEVEFEFIIVDLFGGENKDAPFLSKNPFGQVPVLQDGDLTLFESRAITSYVTEKYKGQGYDLVRHGNPKEAALVKVWMEVESHRYHPSISPIIYECLVYPAYGRTPNQAVIDASVAKLANVLDVYEARLSSSKYLAGDFYSLADLHHISYTFYLLKTPYADLITSRPHVNAWWEDISSRPASKKVLINMVLGDKKE